MKCQWSWCSIEVRLDKPLNKFRGMCDVCEAEVKQGAAEIRMFGLVVTGLKRRAR